MNIWEDTVSAIVKLVAVSGNETLINAVNEIHALAREAEEREIAALIDSFSSPTRASEDFVREAGEG